MSFAQTRYLQAQGIPPTKYSIAQIGCFLTSFCNLLTDRFGKPVDPLTLNAIFRDRGIYTDVDDGVRDDLGWSSVVAYDGSVTVVATGGIGWPSSDNSIVKFYYQSISHPWLDAAKTKKNMTTHFTLVASAARHTIVDSWDGAVKSPGAYGTPVAWASYAQLQPQVVTAPPPPVVVAPATPVVVETPGHVDVVQAEAVNEPIAVLSSTWKETFNDKLAGDYKATQDWDIKDVEGLQVAVVLHKGDIVHAEGSFDRDGVVYLRSEKSTANGWWYGVTLDKVVPFNAHAIDDITDEELVGINVEEVHAFIAKKSVREKFIKGLGYIIGFFERIITAGNKKNKNNQETTK